MALKRLEEKKMLVTRPHSRTQGQRGRPRVVYELTPEGCSAMDQLVRTITKLDLDGHRDPQTGKILLEIEPDLSFIEK